MENRHYFTKDNDSLPSNPKIIKMQINKEAFEFKTDNGVFSKDFLDYATRIFLENLAPTCSCDSILDVGCGYGPIGIYLAKKYQKEVIMLDVNIRALELARYNVSLNNCHATVLESDCLEQVLNRKFSLIVTNPPIRAGKEIVYKIFSQSHEVLLPNGELWLVIQQKHGAPSAIKKLQEIFQNVDIVYKKKGFFVLKCKKID